MDGRIWTRRTFVSTLGVAGVAAAAPKLSEAASASESTACGSYRAFVGTSSGSLAAYRVDGGQWTQHGPSVAVDSPRGLALHPSLPVLYATDAVDGHDNRPRGSVAAFRITPGGLEKLNTQGTALSATAPEHLSVVDDMLLVSSTGGGAYNAFSLADDGAILPVRSTLKQIGFGPHPSQETAAPHASVVGELGAYSSDLGADRINHLVFAEGAARVASKVSLPAGSGPGHLALAPSGQMLVVASRLRPALTVLPVDRRTGTLESALHQLALPLAEAGPVVLNASGDRVYVAGIDHAGETVVASFGLSRATGRLRALQVVTAREAGRPEQMVLGTAELLLAGSGGVTRIPLLPNRMGDTTLALRTPGAVSLILASV